MILAATRERVHKVVPNAPESADAVPNFREGREEVRRHAHAGNEPEGHPAVEQHARGVDVLVHVSLSCDKRA